MMAGTFFKWLVPGMVAIAGGTSLALTQAAPALTASLEARTRAALADDFDWAEIEIEGRDAILTGTAANQAEIDAAAARLAGVEGIRVAQAEAVVAEPSPVEAAPARPSAVPTVAPYLWSATKSADGSISLAGYLPTEALKQTVLERAGPGVDDKTSIATGAPSGFTNDVLAGLDALALMGEGKASFDGGRWTLSGTVASPDAREAALAALDAGTRNEELWLTTITDEAPSVSSVAPPSEAPSAASGSIVSLEPIAPPPDGEPPSAEPAASEPSSAPPSAAPSSSEPSSAAASPAPSSAEPVSSSGPLPASSQGQSSSSAPAEPPPPPASSSSVAASSSQAPVEPPALASSQPPAMPAPPSESPSSPSAPAEPPTTEPAAEPSSAQPSSLASAPPPPAAPSLEPRRQETAPSSSAPPAAPSAPTPSMPAALVFSADKPAGGEIVETGAEPADESPADTGAPPSSATPSGTAAVPAAPSAFAANREAGLTALGQLEQGRIGFDGRRWWLTGKAATQAIRDSVAATVAALPAAADWSVEIDILPAVEACRLRVDGLADRNAILFAPASARLADGSSAALDELAADLAICPGTFVHVEGHTDADGADEANLILSVSRAEAVVAALVERGVDEGRLYAEGYGESRPIASNDTREGKQQNRRIAFRITEE